MVTQVLTEHVEVLQVLCPHVLKILNIMLSYLQVLIVQEDLEKPSSWSASLCWLLQLLRAVSIHLSLVYSLMT